MDETRGLRQFIEVARHGSFTRAAEHLGVSTSALSQSIAGLERRLGMRLFLRTTRLVHLSADGQRLYDRVSMLFEDLKLAIDEVGAASHLPEGEVRLSTVTAFGKHCVLPLLPEFFAAYPGIHVAMNFHDGAPGLTRQSFDIRIHWGEQPEQGKVAQVLSTMPLVLVASPQYLTRHGEPRTPADLAQHGCIATALPGGPRGRWVFEKTVGRRPAAKSDRIEVLPRGKLLVMGELEAVANAARAGLGLTVIASTNILDELRTGTLVRVLTNYTIRGHDQLASEIMIQYPERRQMSPKVAALVDFLLGKLRRKDAMAIALNRGR